MGGKLSNEKKGYNVNDEKAKGKDKKALGTGTEEEGTPKENDTQEAMETTKVKMGEKRPEKDAQDTSKKTEEKEGDKDTTVTKEEAPKAEPEMEQWRPNPTPLKDTEQEQAAASVLAASDDAPKAPEVSADAEVETMASTKVDDKSKEEGKPKKTEVPDHLGNESDGAPASDSKRSSTEAAPSSKQTPTAMEAPSFTPYWFERTNVL